jgi:uncharacterized membrane protein YidH (DUF202 family)
MTAPDADRGRGGGEGVRTRDHLANVRTFLAFQRAGVALLVVGLAIDKLGLVVTAEHGVPVPLSRTEERITAVAVAVAGLALVLASFARFLLQRRVIEGSVLRTRVLLDLSLLGLIAVTGVLIAVHLLRIGA